MSLLRFTLRHRWSALGGRAKYLVMAWSVLFAGCFPIELDVNDRGELLVPRQEGFVLFHPKFQRMTPLAGPGKGQPVFARFAPGFKEALFVVKDLERGDFRFDLMALPKGEPRTVFRAGEAGYALFTPDGSHIGIIRSSDRRHPNFSGALPELVLVSLKDSSIRSIAEGVAASCRFFADSKRVLLFQMDDINKQADWSGHLVEWDFEAKKGRKLAALITRHTMSLELSPDNERVVFSAHVAVGPEQMPDPKMSAGWKLFELTLSDLKIRPIDNPVNAQFAKFSPSGKKLLMLGEGGLAVADAFGNAPLVLAKDVAEQVGAELKLPGWVDEGHIYYFKNQSTFGVSSKTLSLALANTDGSGVHNVQPYLDMAAYRLTKLLPNQLPANAKDPKAPFNITPWDREREEEQNIKRPIVPESPALSETAYIAGLKFSPDGRWLAGGGGYRDDRCSIWEIKTGKLMGSFRAPLEMSVFSADGKSLFALNPFEKTLTVFEVESAKSTKEIKLPEWNNDYRFSQFFALSQDGKSVLAAFNNTNLVKIDLADGKVEKLANKLAYFRDAAYAPALDAVVSVVSGIRDDQAIHVSKPGQADAMKKTPLTAAPRYLVVSADGKTLAISCDAERVWKKFDHTEVWDVETMKLRTILPKEGDDGFRYYERMALSPDGKFLAGISTKRKAPVDLWDTTTGKLIRKLDGSGRPTALVFTADGGTLIVGYDLQSPKFFESATGDEKPVPPGKK